MGFKDYVAADVSAVFINPDEFGEEHDIDGESISIVLDSDIIQERSERMDMYEDGTFQNRIIFFVRKDDLGYVPEENQLMHFNGMPGIVNESREEMGVIRVALEMNRA